MLAKDEVKKLCEANSRLEWWAMVLFAEIADLVRTDNSCRYGAETIYPLVVSKVKEFQQLVVQCALEKADKCLAMDERVANLERIVDEMRNATK